MVNIFQKKLIKYILFSVALTAFLLIATDGVKASCGTTSGITNIKVCYGGICYQCPQTITEGTVTHIGTEYIDAGEGGSEYKYEHRTLWEGKTQIGNCIITEGNNDCGTPVDYFQISPTVGSHTYTARAFTGLQSTTYCDSLDDLFDGNELSCTIVTTAACAPNCSTNCGQADGCGGGGTCPNTDVNTCGKCGNLAVGTSCSDNNTCTSGDEWTQEWTPDGQTPTSCYCAGTIVNNLTSCNGGYCCGGVCDITRTCSLSLDCFANACSGTSWTCTSANGGGICGSDIATRCENPAISCTTGQRQYYTCSEGNCNGTASWTDVTDNSYCEDQTCDTGKTCESGVCSDTTPPNTPLVAWPSSSQKANFSVSVSGDSDVGGSGITCYYHVFDSGVNNLTKSWQSRICNSSFTVTVGPGQDCRTAGGTCTVYVFAQDGAGNDGVAVTRTFDILSFSTRLDCAFSNCIFDKTSVLLKEQVVVGGYLKTTGGVPIAGKYLSLWYQSGSDYIQVTEGSMDKIGPTNADGYAAPYWTPSSAYQGTKNYILSFHGESPYEPSTINPYGPYSLTVTSCSKSTDRITDTAEVTLSDNRKCTIAIEHYGEDATDNSSVSYEALNSTNNLRRIGMDDNPSSGCQNDLIFTNQWFLATDKITLTSTFDEKNGTNDFNYGYKLSASNNCAFSGYERVSCTVNVGTPLGLSCFFPALSTDKKSMDSTQPYSTPPFNSSLWPYQVISSQYEYALIPDDPPTSVITSPPDDTWYSNGDIAIQVQDQDDLNNLDLDGCRYSVWDAGRDTWSVGGGGYIDAALRRCNDTIDISVGSSGVCQSSGPQACQVFVYSKDKAGNVSETTANSTGLYNVDLTPPTSSIKVIRESTNENVAEEAWLRADTYTVQLKDDDPAPSSGWKSCEYSVFACDEDGVNCITPKIPISPRDCNTFSFEITPSKTDSVYNLEGGGRYHIWSRAIDNGMLSDSKFHFLYFDFSPPTAK